MEAQLSCPLCGSETEAAGLEAHLRLELRYFALRCGLCLWQFLSPGDAEEHFAGEFSRHPGQPPCIVEVPDKAKSGRLREALASVGLGLGGVKLSATAPKAPSGPPGTLGAPRPGGAGGSLGGRPGGPPGAMRGPGGALGAARGPGGAAGPPRGAGGAPGALDKRPVGGLRGSPVRRAEEGGGPRTSTPNDLDSSGSVRISPLMREREAQAPTGARGREPRERSPEPQRRGPPQPHRPAQGEPGGRRDFPVGPRGRGLRDGVAEQGQDGRAGVFQRPPPRSQPAPFPPAGRGPREQADLSRGAGLHSGRPAPPFRTSTPDPRSDAPGDLSRLMAGRPAIGQDSRPPPLARPTGLWNQQTSQLNTPSSDRRPEPFGGPRALPARDFGQGSRGPLSQPRPLAPPMPAVLSAPLDLSRQEVLSPRLLAARAATDLSQEDSRSTSNPLGVIRSLRDSPSPLGDRPIVPPSDTRPIIPLVAPPLDAARLEALSPRAFTLLPPAEERPRERRLIRPASPSEVLSPRLLAGQRGRGQIGRNHPSRQQRPSAWDLSRGSEGRGLEADATRSENNGAQSYMELSSDEEEPEPPTKRRRPHKERPHQDTEAFEPAASISQPEELGPQAEATLAGAPDIAPSTGDLQSWSSEGEEEEPEPRGRRGPSAKAAKAPASPADVTTMEINSDVEEVTEKAPSPDGTEKCGQCSERVPLEELVHHATVSHSNLQPYRCNLCAYRTKAKEAAAAHSQKKHCGKDVAELFTRIDVRLQLTPIMEACFGEKGKRLVRPKTKREKNPSSHVAAAKRNPFQPQGPIHQAAAMRVFPVPVLVPMPRPFQAPQAKPARPRPRREAVKREAASPPPDAQRSRIASETRGSRGRDASPQGLPSPRATRASAKQRAGLGGPSPKATRPGSQEAALEEALGGIQQGRSLRRGRSQGSPEVQTLLAKSARSSSSTRSAKTCKAEPEVETLEPPSPGRPSEAAQSRAEVSEQAFSAPSEVASRPASPAAATSAIPVLSLDESPGPRGRKATAGSRPEGAKEERRSPVLQSEEEAGGSGVAQSAGSGATKGKREEGESSRAQLKSESVSGAEAEEGGKPQCKVCSLALSRADVKRHIASEHLRQVIRRCRLCQFESGDFDELAMANHLRKRHGRDLTPRTCHDASKEVAAIIKRMIPALISHY